MAVDGQLVARTVGELRATLAEAGDLLGGLQRVVDATRMVVGVDGVGRTLAHEDGPPRWVATTDRRRTGSWPWRTWAGHRGGTGSRPWSASCRCAGW